MSKHVVIAWSFEEYEALREIARDRGLTAAQVRAQLNDRFGNDRTRNAVLGASHRIGVAIGHGNKGVITSAIKRKGKGEGRLRDRFKEKLRAEKRRRKAFMMPPASEPIVIPPLPPMRRGPPYSVADLRHNSCRWIEGDPQDERPFGCGDPAVELKPYCAAHLKRAFGPSHKGRMVV